MVTTSDHITVCICTYKRPKLLGHLLKELQGQITNQYFTYSIVVVDNDCAESAQSTVASFRDKSLISIDYYCEPEQNIALTRNKAVNNAKGNYIAFIDDDEFPCNNWLLNLFKSINCFEAAGVLGPVRPHFGTIPAKWIVKSKVFERPLHRSGTLLQWQNTRTGNVLLRKEIFKEGDNMFNPEFGSGGEDRDLFRRIIEQGCTLRWCNEAPVYESVPLERCKRYFLLRRALLRGSISPNTIPYFGITDIITSLIAILAYTLTLPFSFVIGHHLFMKYLIKDFDHIGRLISVCGLNFGEGKYIGE